MPDLERLELGGGVAAILRICECRDEYCDHSKPCGMTFVHTTPAGEPCDAGSWIWFGELRHGWRIVKERPLTILPSLECTRCGRHGFIIDGKWRDV